MPLLGATVACRMYAAFVLERRSVTQNTGMGAGNGNLYNPAFSGRLTAFPAAAVETTKSCLARCNFQNDADCALCSRKPQNVRNVTLNQVER